MTGRHDTRARATSEAAGELRATRRLFFAAPVDVEAGVVAERVAHTLAAGDADSSVRWVPRANYHVTLRFLGPTPDAQIPDLVAAVRRESAGQEAFLASLGSLLWLPSPRRPRVVALSVESEGGLEALAAGVERAVCRAGVAPEPRSFHPHLTLGRARRGRRVPPGLREVAPVDADTSFPVDAALLFESQLSQRGARYHALERIPLGASHHPH